MNKVLAILALCLLATTAIAEESSGSSGGQGASNEATERMEEHLESSESESQGSEEAPGGGAEPTENWFGCPPGQEGEQEEECEKSRNEAGEVEGAS
ncbi:hypothetical protein ACGTNG_01990 [Halomonas sp. 1390]|uniref:hypothetical protein n=1 Tax=Halomonas sp. B23F22_3 TaxID=3459516 RepID=UPI00373E95CA